MMNLIIYKFIINVRAMRGIFGDLSVCDFDHCETDDTFAHDKAGLEYLRDDVFSEALVLDVHHGVVALRVERLAAEVGDAPDIIGAEHGKQAVGDLVGERLAVGKVPRLFVEAVSARSRLS